MKAQKMKKDLDIKVNGHQLKDKVIHVMVGDYDRPAGPNDITDVQKAFEEVLDGIPCRLIVTHHLVRVSVY